VINDIYTYWVQKRSKLKRPLLRRFWPVTSTEDTNPHLVFRPREKEKYKLRKKRQDDLDSYQKLKQLRSDFDNLRAVMDVVKRREELHRAHVQLQVDLFSQRLHDTVDTSGQHRVPNSSKEELKRVLDIPLHFNMHDGTRKAKRVRQGGSDHLALSMPGSGMVYGARDGKLGSSDGLNVNIAGRNQGEPAPLFLHPLYTRETYATTWEGTAPHVTTYVDSHALPTFRFRHRPRVGRGGRLCIDRVPYPPDPNMQTISVFTAGRGLPQSLKVKERLLDLLPRPLDHGTLSRKIEEMSVAAIKEDFEARTVGPAAGEPDENDGDEKVVKLRDWLETDEQLWGEERFAIGPV
jgi:enhancer of polycomb-like protein